MKEKKHETVTRVDHNHAHTSPAWRVAGVALAFGAIAAMGFYFREIGYVDEFATVAVITAAGSIGYWARKRPDRLRRRFGPFGRIADAIRESGDDIREYVHIRPLRVGVVIAALYGVAVVLAKSLVVAVLMNVYAWPLAVAAGCAVGAIVAAPEFFSNLFKRLQVPDDEETFEEPEDEDEALEEDDDENEIEATRRRRASGEE